MKRVLILFFTIFLNGLCYSQKISVKLHAIEGYGANAEFAQKAITALETVLNSAEFREGIKSMQAEKTRGYSPEKLYEVIMQAHEENVPKDANATDGVVDLWVRTLDVNGKDAEWKKYCEKPSIFGNQTIGIDGAGDGVMAICPSALDFWASKNDVASLAGHYAHEYMHVLGFDHARFMSSQAWREKTFVYKVGYLVRDLIKKMNSTNP